MNLANDFPMIPHSSVGTDCPGCIIPEGVETDQTKLVCNECGEEVGAVKTAILADLVTLVNREPPSRLSE